MRLGDGVREPQRKALETGPEEALLGAEELVDDRLRNARAPRQLIHRRLRKAALGKQLLAELDELPLAHGTAARDRDESPLSASSFHLLTVGYQE